MVDAVPGDGMAADGPGRANGPTAASTGGIAISVAARSGTATPAGSPPGKLARSRLRDNSADRPCDDAPDSTPPYGSSTASGCPLDGSYAAAQGSASPSRRGGTDDNAVDSSAAANAANGGASGSINGGTGGATVAGGARAAEGSLALAAREPSVNGFTPPATAAQPAAPLPPPGAHTVSISSPPAAPHGESMLPAVIRDALRRASNRRTLSFENNVHKEFNNGDTYQGAAPKHTH